MTRRWFLSLLSRGAVATAVAVHVPTAALQAVGLGPATERFALDRLLRLFHTYCKTYQRMPTHIALGRDFFAAIEEEMIATQRFVWNDDPLVPTTIAFKGTRVTEVGAGWNVVFS